ncbi:uncharacterized protein VTP21DRAFT_4717 [Calcarisporiella thermophila]|uniref:uncharacterized protein n=1 Tax=Calcarisporiella thermophila TaxID=911321 RepID=UPI003743F361
MTIMNSIFNSSSEESPRSTLLQHDNNTGQVGSLSTEQEYTLEQFRQNLQKKGLYDPKRHDHYLLLRFLRARKFDLDAALEMFANCENWRRDENVDELEYFEFTERDEVSKIYPRFYHRTDRIFRPLYIECMNDLDIDKLFSITTEERIEKDFIKGYEYLTRVRFPACSAAAGKHIEQCCILIDIKDLSLKQVPKALKFVEKTSRIAQDYYPEMMGCMFVINAPSLFSGVWSMIKPFLDEDTVAKIHILGTNYLDEVLKVVDPKSLPKFLGGDCECPEGCENSDVGPWKDPKYTSHQHEAREE